MAGVRHPGSGPETLESVVILYVQIVDACSRAQQRQLVNRIAAVIHRVIDLQNHAFVDIESDFVRL